MKVLWPFELGGDSRHLADIYYTTEKRVDRNVNKIGLHFICFIFAKTNATIMPFEGFTRAWHSP